MGIPNSKDSLNNNNDGDDGGVTLESPPGADYVKIKGKHGNDQIFVHKGTDLWYFIEKIEGTINAKNYFLKRYPNLPPKLEKYLDALDSKYDKIYKKKGDSDEDTDNSESEEEESDNEESESEEEEDSDDEDSGEDTGKAKLSDVGGIGDKVPSNGDQKKINEFEIASKLNQISNQQQLTKRNENGNSMSFKEFELNKKIEHEMIKDDNKPLSSSSTPQQIKRNLTTSDKKRPNLFQLVDNRLLELFVLWKQTFQFENIIFDKIRLLQEERLEKQKIERATIISPPPLSSKSFTFVPMSPQNDDYNNISFGRKNTPTTTAFENVSLSSQQPNQDLDKYFLILVKWINENNNNIKVYNEGQKLYLEKVQLLHSEYARRYNENKKNYELLVNEKKTEKQMKMQEKIEMENKPLPPVPLIMTGNNNNNNNIQNQYQNVYPSFHTLNLANNIVNQSLSPPVQLHTTITITSSPDEDFELPIDEDYMKYVNACFLNLDKWFFLKLKELDNFKERQQLLFRKIMDQNLIINKDSSVILKKKPTSTKRRKPRVTRQQQQDDDDNSSSSEDEYSDDDGENSNNIV